MVILGVHMCPQLASVIVFLLLLLIFLLAFTQAVAVCPVLGVHQQLHLELSS